jgi:hypothetical protein
MLLDAFDGDVDACTTVAVVLMPTVPTFESLLVAVRSLGVPAQRTPLTRLVQIIESPNRGRFVESEAVNPVAPVVNSGAVSGVVVLWVLILAGASFLNSNFLIVMTGTGS